MKGRVLALRFIFLQCSDGPSSHWRRRRICEKGLPHKKDALTTFSRSKCQGIPVALGETPGSTVPRFVVVTTSWRQARFYSPPIVQTNANTFPRLLLAHAERQPDAPAVREKDLGIWQTWSWSAVAREVREICLLYTSPSPRD